MITFRQKEAPTPTQTKAEENRSLGWGKFAAKELA
jgi:hypothetical protein